MLACTSIVVTDTWVEPLWSSAHSLHSFSHIVQCRDFFVSLSLPERWSRVQLNGGLLYGAGATSLWPLVSMLPSLHDTWCTRACTHSDTPVHNQSPPIPSSSLLLPASLISRTINQTVPTLIRNPNAWNMIANVLLCECTHTASANHFSNNLLSDCMVIILKWVINVTVVNVLLFGATWSVCAVHHYRDLKTLITWCPVLLHCTIHKSSLLFDCGLFMHVLVGVLL